MNKHINKGRLNIQLFGNTAKTSIIEQTPATTNSIATSKPYVSKVSNLLEGYVANSWNGGNLKTVAYKKIMAGEKITNYSLSGMIRMITPKVPVAQKLSATFKVFFVPNTRVWNNAERYLAQKGGTSVTKIIKKPAFTAAQLMPKKVILNQTVTVPLTDTTVWRDSFPSSYIPRIYTGNQSSAPTEILAMPEVSVLALRGYKAIYNDMLRHKTYDSAFTEYKDDTVSTAEFNTLIPPLPAGTYGYENYIRDFIKRGRRKDSYYTNYRTQSEGQNNTVVPMYTNLMEHNEWQKKIAESRSQVENEQKNDWDIVAEIRGSVPVSDGKVQFLSMKEVGINYTQVSQTTYNTNEVVAEDQQILGATGSYSFTDFNISLLNYHEFKEDGYLHVIQQTSADTIFEAGIDRNELNVTWDSEYRPDFKELKEDTLMSKENGLVTVTGSASNVGFKRKYSENFKLVNSINGDMTSTPIYQVDQQGNITTTLIPLKKEFQFFETSAGLFYNDNTNIYANKNIWQDYTDLLINKNLAIRETVRSSVALPAGAFWVEGANQLFMIAKASCITNLPIDDTIKNDFKTWGEQ